MIGLIVAGIFTVIGGYWAKEMYKAMKEELLGPYYYDYRTRHTYRRKRVMLARSPSGRVYVRYWDD